MHCPALLESVENSGVGVAMKHSRPNELLDVNSASLATLDEALEQWCVFDGSFVGFMDAH